jgi:threonine aldolase
MDRRTFLHTTVVAAAAVSMSSPAVPATANAAAPSPVFPQADSRSVWLVGDRAPTESADFAAQLWALAQGQDNLNDNYLAGGAVTALEKAFANLLGKADCAFFPTGTLANTVALRLLCGEHRRALVQHESHLYRDESDATQTLSGINLVPLAEGRATPTLAEIGKAFDDAEKGPYPVRIGAVSIESPVRRAYGDVVPIATVADIAKLARAHGAALHLDAARLMLAPGIDLRAYCAHFDTVYVSLYKYLDAPFGAVLAGSEQQIAQAREWRHLYGGSIHQGWVPAVMALQALKAFPARMLQAHADATALFKVLAASRKVSLRLNWNASNIRYLEVPEALATQAFERCRVAGVRLAKWKDGALPIYINPTLSRRPVAELAALILG